LPVKSARPWESSAERPESVLSPLTPSGELSVNVAWLAFTAVGCVASHSMSTAPVEGASGSLGASVATDSPERSGAAK
jgi:hypothetical protein